jgi:ribosomal protein S18 acetylase RimI-like enzyme
MTTDDTMASGVLPTDSVPVRALRDDDLAVVVKIDTASMGRPREEYYRAKFREATSSGSGPRTSLVAEVDGHPVGFLHAKVYFGEFGQAEPVAVIDSIGVDPRFRSRHVGQALLRQLLINLQALRVERVQTEVDWGQIDLLHFMHKNGFQPAARVCLERRLDV